MNKISEFTKLFKANIPVYSHSEYYIETLKKSLEYSELQSQIELFERFEIFIDNSDFTSIKNYKLDYALNRAIEKIENTSAYKSFLVTTSSVGSRNIDKNSIFENHENKILISIDFKNANYNTLKLFDTNNELAIDWKNFISNLSLHPVLGESKSFRQFVLGNLNSKRNMKYQNMLMGNNIDFLIDKGLKDNIVFISHDEVILAISENENFAEIDIILNEMPSALPTSRKKYTLKKLDGKGIYLQNILPYGKYDKEFKKLVSVPANKYFRYFKEYILNEPIDERDLLFMIDDEIAKWVI